ncbi:MAG: adenylate/guanylate cyclase domain-containing protein [Desulfobacteraceae bacterium]|jgi:class 3 adenylate cyclase
MIRSLQQRLALFLLLPTALLLFLMGLLGFIYARGIMLSQWREAAILKLERAAHHVDMRLSKPIMRIKMFQRAADEQEMFNVQQWIVDRLRELDGVSQVDLKELEEKAIEMRMPGRGMGMGRRAMMRFHHARISEVTSPVYDAQAGEETVSLISTLEDQDGAKVGELKVTMRFEYLMQDIRALGWWQSDLAYLVDTSGRYLAKSEATEKGHVRLGENNDALELAILEQMQEKPFGTILGPGHPPEKVGGFYRIKQAPWTMVIFAPGKEVLAPIIKYRFYYAIAGIFCIALILLLIRYVGGKMVRSVGQISRAAEQVAGGKYGDPLSVKTRDEIGQLTQSFNTMVQGLKERDFISNTFGRYVDQEIARELMRRPEASRLGGEKREVAILMSDLRDFTPLSETLSPDVTIRMLNRYFSRIIETIQKHQGIIVDFFGDALLVFFDPLEGPIVPVINRSIDCALEMQRIMEIFNAENRAEDLPELKMGIGVNAGEVVVGNIGSETRAKYGIVGSAVNVTQRIQSEAEGGEVVISESVYSAARDQVTIKKSFEAQLKGIQGNVKLYVVVGLQAKA